MVCSLGILGDFKVKSEALIFSGLIRVVILFCLVFLIFVFLL